MKDCNQEQLGRSPLFRQLGGSLSSGGHHIDTELRADTLSAYYTKAQKSWTQVILLSYLSMKLGLQVCVTTPGWQGLLKSQSL